MLIGIIMFYEVNDEVARWIAVGMHSFWLPQIVHSVYTNAQRPLSRYKARGSHQAGGQTERDPDADRAASVLGSLCSIYIIGMSLARLYIPLCTHTPPDAPEHVIGC